MVKGLNKFKEYFKGFENHYIIIGGTACDEHISDAGLNYRVTKDIDLILVVEALNKAFATRFWDFIKDGGYLKKEKSADKREYYRFMMPTNTEFPEMIEIFSRKPNEITLTEPTHLTPIPTDEDLSSLSAILMDNNYYDYLLQHSREFNGVMLADIPSLICLKAKAFLEIRDRIEKGLEKNDKKAQKHKKDVFRLAMLLPENAKIELPNALLKDIADFAKTIEHDLPGKALFKDAGVPTVKAEALFGLIKQTFLNV
jgi:hypothetical protein